METNVFVAASRQKLRFNRPGGGNISVEDLWDLSLEDLDAIAKSVNKILKDTTEESFIKKANPGNKWQSIRLEIVVFVINTKMAEDEKRAKAAEVRLKRAKLLEVIAQKQDTAMASKSITVLKAELEKLEEELEEA